MLCGTQGSPLLRLSFVASVLEWPTGDFARTLTRTLHSIASYYKLKNSTRPSRKTENLIRSYVDAAAIVTKGKKPGIQAAKALFKAHQAGIQLVGDPIEDWEDGCTAATPGSFFSLKEISNEARMVPFSKSLRTPCPQE